MANTTYQPPLQRIIIVENYFYKTGEGKKKRGSKDYSVKLDKKKN